jgi:hypothetical protein
MRHDCSFCLRGATANYRFETTLAITPNSAFDEFEVQTEFVVPADTANQIPGLLEFSEFSGFLDIKADDPDIGSGAAGFEEFPCNFLVEARKASGFVLTGQDFNLRGVYTLSGFSGLGAIGSLTLQIVSCAWADGPPAVGCNAAGCFRAGTSEETVARLCQRLSDCGELIRTTAPECIEQKNTCLDEEFPTTSEREAWAGTVEVCQALNTCPEFANCLLTQVEICW